MALSFSSWIGVRWICIFGRIKGFKSCRHLFLQGCKVADTKAGKLGYIRIFAATESSGNYFWRDGILQTVNLGRTRHCWFLAGYNTFWGEASAARSEFPRHLFHKTPSLGTDTLVNQISKVLVCHFQQLTEATKSLAVVSTPR